MALGLRVEQGETEEGSVIRQAQSYLAGAISSTALIGAAVVLFALLITTQGLRDWPISGLGLDKGANDEVSVAPVKPAAGGAAGADAAAVQGGGSATGGGSPAAGSGAPGQANVGRPGGAGSGPAPDSPVASAPGSQPNGQGPGSGGGGGAASGSNPGSGGATGGGGGQSTSGNVANTVNDTVNAADDALGGALGKSGVTKATEDVVDRVAGPDSPVGETVDKAGEAVEGLLPGRR
jgi:hypothetical protein